MGTDVDIALLVKELCHHDAETEWIEFKTNNSDAEMTNEFLTFGWEATPRSCGSILP